MLNVDVSRDVIKSETPALDTQRHRLDVTLRGATRLAAEVERFLSGIHTLPWDEIAADEFAEVRTDLERVGTPVGVMDTMIAAHATSVGATLVTNNVKHFHKVKGLSVENWVSFP